MQRCGKNTVVAPPELQSQNWAVPKVQKRTEARLPGVSNAFTSNAFIDSLVVLCCEEVGFNVSKIIQTLCAKASFGSLEPPKGRLLTAT